VKTPQEQAIEEHVEALCIQDHEEHVGKILLATVILGYAEEAFTEEFYCDPPARIRVLQMNHSSMLNWTCREFCDPDWDIELVEPHPALEHATSIWIDGISRATDGEVQHPSAWKLDENQEPPPPAPKAQPEEHIKLQPAYTHDTKVFCPHCCREIVVTTTMSIDTDEMTRP